MKLDLVLIKGHYLPVGTFTKFIINKVNLKLTCYDFGFLKDFISTDNIKMINHTNCINLTKGYKLTPRGDLIQEELHLL